MGVNLLLLLLLLLLPLVSPKLQSKLMCLISATVSARMNPRGECMSISHRLVDEGGLQRKTGRSLSDSDKCRRPPQRLSAPLREPLQPNLIKKVSAQARQSLQSALR